MATRIKFCGLRTAEAIDLAADLGAWKAGFIFFARSPRHVTVEEAARLAAHARERRLETAAVTVNASADELDAIVAHMRPDLLQFHGAETPEGVAAAKARYGLPVMKAVSVREAADIDAAHNYRQAVDYLLFDARPPKGAELPGGNGISFDWRLLAGLADTCDYVLSGGLTAETVGDALATTGARAIDVSSGIESAPGAKDPARMRAFAEAVARHDTNAAQEMKERVS